MGDRVRGSVASRVEELMSEPAGGVVERVNGHGQRGEATAVIKTQDPNSCHPQAL